jgi:hypothetical protein
MHAQNFEHSIVIATHSCPDFASANFTTARNCSQFRAFDFYQYTQLPRFALLQFHLRHPRASARPTSLIPLVPTQNLAFFEFLTVVNGFVRLVIFRMHPRDTGSPGERLPPRVMPPVGDEDDAADHRHYSRFTPPGQHRTFVRCDAFQEAEDGTRIHCTYLKRLDRHKQAVARGWRHECKFAPKHGIESFLQVPARAPLHDAWTPICRYLGATNTPISTGESPALRELLTAMFAEGFLVAAATPRADVEEEFEHFCPALKATAIRKRIVALAEESQGKLRESLRAGTYAAMTMDAGQVGSIRLFVTNLVASQLQICFTAGISETEPMNHHTFREFLECELTHLQKKGVIVSAVVCDGATYQTKALNFADPASIQARHSETPNFSRLLFIPCLCHRLNNAYHRLVRDSAVYGQFIGALRQLGKFCRKTAQKKILKRTCPEFIETRWLYDHRILAFMLDHEHVINRMGNDTYRVEPFFHEFSDLLQSFWELLTALEGSDVPLAAAYTYINDAIHFLMLIRSEKQNEHVSAVYQMAADLIAQYTLDSTHDLIQLAYVLTPKGRQAASQQLKELVGVRPAPRSDFELTLFDFDCQLADHGPGEFEDGADEELPRDDAIREEDDAESSVDHGPAISESVSISVPGSGSPGDYLAHRAHAGLTRILSQFQVSDNEMKETKEIFQVYLTSTEETLNLGGMIHQNVYCWLSATCVGAEYAILAEIALRLEPAICSEAPSERAIGQQRRDLMPHRMRSKVDLLLARTQLEEDGHRACRVKIGAPLPRRTEPK